MIPESVTMILCGRLIIRVQPYFEARDRQHEKAHAVLNQRLSDTRQRSPLGEDFAPVKPIIIGMNPQAQFYCQVGFHSRYEETGFQTPCSEKFSSGTHVSLCIAHILNLQVGWKNLIPTTSNAKAI